MQWKDTEDPNAHILSYIKMEHASESDLKYAIKKCKQHLSQTSVAEFRTSCIERLLDCDFPFERCTSIPYHERISSNLPGHVLMLIQLQVCTSFYILRD